MSVVGFGMKETIIDKDSGVVTLPVVRSGGIRDRILCSYKIAEVIGTEEI